MKYAWRSGNTTYFEDRHFEGTVIFDDRIKPHFVKVEATLAAYAHLSLLLKVFRERRFGAFWGILNVNMKCDDFRKSTCEGNPPAISSILLKFL